MSRVLVPLATGFEEIEASTIVDVLRRGGVEVVVAGLDGAGPCRGARGISFLPDVAWEAAKGPWDLLVLPGGMGGTERMMAHEGLLNVIRERVSAGAPVAAICAAPMVLDTAAVLPERRFTCYPGIEARIRTPGRQPDRLVDAGTVITSQGPATAMEFAIYLVRRLQGEAAKRRVAEGLLVGEKSHGRT